MFMNIARAVAERSTCLRARVGALIVVRDHIVSMGYNGAPPGMPHCLDVGCGGGIMIREGQLDPFPGGEMPRPSEMQDLIEYPAGCTRATHAELNAVAFAARLGIPCDGGTMYCTHATCVNCARAMVAAGIIRSVYREPYRLTDGIQLLDKANVKVEQYA